MPVTVGSLLHVKAKLDSSIWIVSNDCGVVVFEPDYLVSSTSIVGKKMIHPTKAFRVNKNNEVIFSSRYI